MERKKETLSPTEENTSNFECDNSGEERLPNPEYSMEKNIKKPSFWPSLELPPFHSTPTSTQSLRDLNPSEGIHLDLMSRTQSSQNISYDPFIVRQLAKFKGIQPSLPIAFQNELEREQAILSSSRLLNPLILPQAMLSSSLPSPIATARGMFPSHEDKVETRSSGDFFQSTPSFHFLKNIKMENNWFALLTQPNQVQRKAYEKESRYVLPNPLKIGLLSPKVLDKNDITIAYAKIYLTDKSQIFEPGEIFQTTTDNPLQMNTQYEFPFHVQIYKTSGKTGFRLLFQVEYKTQTDAHRIEWILSDPFLVVSNRIRIIQAKMREANKKGEIPDSPMGE